jgi:hypothetical protein
MLTSRANCRSFSAFVNIATVAAFPQNSFILLEDLVIFNIFGQLQITFLMVLLNLSNLTESITYFRETFFFSNFGKSNVQLSPLFVLTLSGSDQVVISCTKSYRIL